MRFLVGIRVALCLGVFTLPQYLNVQKFFTAVFISLLSFRGVYSRFSVLEEPRLRIGLPPCEGDVLGFVGDPPHPSRWMVPQLYSIFVFRT